MQLIDMKSFVFITHFDFNKLIKSCKLLNFITSISQLSLMIPNLKYKTTYCHNFLQGIPCEKGSGCFFAHGQHDLRSLQQVSLTYYVLKRCTLKDISLYKNILTQNKYLIAQKNQVQKNSPEQIDNYKTIYCKFYAKGQCKLGKDCTFAHQKKQKRRKPKIKQQKVQYQNQYYQNQIFPSLGCNIPPQYNMYYPTYFNYFGMGYPNFGHFQQNEVNLNLHNPNNQSQVFQQYNIQSNTSQQEITSSISNLSLNESAQIKDESQKLNEDQAKNQNISLKKSDDDQGQNKKIMAQKDLYEHSKDGLKQSKMDTQPKNKQNQMQRSNEKSKTKSLQQEE